MCVALSTKKNNIAGIHANLDSLLSAIGMLFECYWNSFGMLLECF